MGANQSTAQDQQEATTVVEEQHWREPVADDFEGDLECYSDDEPLSSDEEAEFLELLAEHETLMKLAVYRSSRPIEFPETVDEDIRTQAALRTEQTIAAAIARAEARLGAKIDGTVAAPVAVLTAPAPAPAPAPEASTNPGTPFKMPLPASAAKSAARSTGKKRLATLRKRVAELREIKEGPHPEDEGLGQSPVRKLNFKEEGEPKQEQTEMQEQMAALHLNTDPAPTHEAPTEPIPEAEAPQPTEDHTATPPTSTTPEPESTPVATKSAARSTRAKGQVETPARNTRSTKRTDGRTALKDNKENVDESATKGKELTETAQASRRGRRPANTAN